MVEFNDVQEDSNAHTDSDDDESYMSIHTCAAIQCLLSIQLQAHNARMNKEHSQRPHAGARIKLTLAMERNRTFGTRRPSSKSDPAVTKTCLVDRNWAYAEVPRRQGTTQESGQGTKTEPSYTKALALK